MINNLHIESTLSSETLYLSCIIPLHNEADSLIELNDRLIAVLTRTGSSFEIIYVNDGSTDDSMIMLKHIQAKDHRIRVLSLKKKYGQTAALSVGFNSSYGNLIVTMDADLQNPPEEIPSLISKLNEGWDVVSGIRRRRKDNQFRIILSTIANMLISKVTGVEVHDTGCSLKIFRSEYTKSMELFGDLHRFLPVLAAWKGARVTELPVDHDIRRHGVSKYGFMRIPKVFIDLITIKLLMDYSTRPSHIFGYFGIYTILISILMGSFAIIRAVFFNYQLHSPLTYVSLVFFALGMQSFLLGFIAEIVARIYIREPYTAYILDQADSIDGQLKDK